ARVASAATPSHSSSPLFFRGGGRNLEAKQHWIDLANGYPSSTPHFLDIHGRLPNSRADEAPLGLQGFGLSAPIAALDEEDWPPNPY
ncbi:ankrd52, partial [Symbiodinium natans]